VGQKKDAAAPEGVCHPMEVTRKAHERAGIEGLQVELVVVQRCLQRTWMEAVRKQRAGRGEAVGGGGWGAMREKRLCRRRKQLFARQAAWLSRAGCN
jgi:hypothetical protein